MVSEDTEEELSNQEEPDEEELSMFKCCPVSSGLIEPNVDPSDEHSREELTEPLTSVDRHSPESREV